MLIEKNQQIQKHLQKITSCITSHLDVKSIVLLGSAARDELSCLELSENKVELFSDYEFLIVVEKRPSSAQRHFVQKQLSDIEKNINNPNPLFHIDVIIREEKRLKTFPPIIFTYEMRSNGKTIFGHECLAQIPKVSLDNLDLKNTNEILFKRLWALLIHLPESFIFEKSLSIRQRRVWGYVLSRNALDITTVLLPHQGILLPTYQQRVEKLIKSYDSINFSKSFGEPFPRYISDCLHRRMSLDFNEIDLNLWYAETIFYLRLALESIGHKPKDQTSASVYNEWPISPGEWYNLVRLGKHHLISQGVQPTFQWLHNKKKYHLATGLLNMHQAMIAWQKGDGKTAVTHLQNSQNILSQLLLQEIILTQNSIPNQWLFLRQKWAEFWRTYIRLNDPKYISRFESITTWQYQ